MMDSKLKILLKAEIRQTFGQQTADDPEKSRRRTIGYTAGLIVVYVLMAVLATGLFYAMGTLLAGTSMLIMIPIVAMAASCLFDLFTSIYKTNGLLFGTKDYDLLMALPIPTRTVVTARLCILYIWNLLYCLVIMVPAGIIYAVFAQPGALFYIFYILGLLLTPLLPSVVASIIGTIVAMIATRFRRRGIAGTVFTVLFMVVYMLFVLNADEIMDSLAQNSTQIVSAISTVYAPAEWLMRGCCEPNVPLFLLFAGVSIGVFAVFVAVVGKHYRGICTRIMSVSAAKSDYKVETLTAAGPMKALVRKEWKRLIGTSQYFLNTCIGYIMAVVFAVIVVVLGPTEGLGTVADLETLREAGVPFDIGVISLFFGLFMVLSSPAACSISLEKETRWITKTAPVSTWTILCSKLALSVLITLLCSFVIGILLNIALPTSSIARILFFAAPLACGLYSALCGLWLDLCYPVLEWTSEIRVLKRSKPVTILVLTGMVMVMAAFVASIVLGIGVAIAAVCGIFVLDFIFYMLIRTRGTKKYEAIPG